jgi:DNA-binding IclR family transcriptional regulator
MLLQGEIQGFTIRNKVGDVKATMQKDLRLNDGEQRPRSSVQTIQRASAILRCFMESEPEQGVTLIGQRVGMHKSTVSRLLSALHTEGFVEQNPENGKWRLGLGLLDLAGAVLERMDLHKLTVIPLKVLSTQTQETINLTVRDGKECVNIETIPSSRSIQHTGRLGQRTPLHCTSTGKAFLAFLASDERDVLLSGTMRPFTENSIVDKRVLEQALDQVRKQGYATAIEEYEEGLSAVAAPIFDHTGQVVATVSISGPCYRMGLDQIKRFIKPLKDTAHNISNQLGYVRPNKYNREI